MQSEQDRNSVHDADAKKLVRATMQLCEAERQDILNAAAGLLRDRDDLPDKSELRKSWDRDLVD